MTSLDLDCFILYLLYRLSRRLNAHLRAKSAPVFRDAGCVLQ